MSDWQPPSIEQQEDIAVVRLSGALDAQTSPELEALLDGLRARGQQHVVLDLARVGMVTSAGFGVFLGALGAFLEAGGGLGLAAMPPGVVRVFDLLGFRPLFPVGATVDEARSQLREGMT
ncbi:MAG: STAS domain-containing protein [bacterium]|nr:STAS domain-containing protein [bacterium]